jgi:drug/metabolite transporter (DMT)-like permease
MSAADAETSRFGAGLGVALAAFSAATFGFGTTLAVFAYNGGSNPLTVVLLRTAAFAVFIGLAMVALGRFRLLSRRALIGSLWMAAALIVVALGYQGSVAYIPVSLAALVFYSYPLLVALISAISRQDRMTLWKGVALVAAFAGLALALSPGFDILDPRGIALALAAALAMATMMTFGGQATKGEDALVMGVYTNVWMLVALCVIALATNSIALPATPLGVFGAGGLCATYVIAYSCWYLAINLVTPVRLAALFNVEPLVTLIVAWLALDERMSGPQFLGAALVLVSVLSVSLGSKEETEEPA